MDGEKYFVAFYGNGDNNKVINCFKKIKVDSISKLVQANKFSWIKLDNTNKKYFSIGFYKKDMDEASMIIQIEDKNDSSIKKWLKYLRILYKGINFPKEAIDKEFLQDIFYSLSDTRATEVANAINKYYKDYNIDTPERMAHFIGQIGVESGGLKSINENAKYTARRLVQIFPYASRGHFYQIAVWNDTTKTYSYKDINFNVNKCTGGKTGGSAVRGSQIHYTTEKFDNADHVRNAYGDVLQLQTGKSYYKFSNRNDITKDNFTSKVSDEDYNSGKLRIKDCYLGKTEALDVAYACRNGNGPISSGDGSRYLGKGFIQLTGKDNYSMVYKEWKKGDASRKNIDIKKFMELLGSDIEVAIEASFAYWKVNNINQYIPKKKLTETSMNKVGGKINKGNPEKKALHNKERKGKTKAAYNQLKK